MDDRGAAPRSTLYEGAYLRCESAEEGVLIREMGVFGGYGTFGNGMVCWSVMIWCLRNKIDHNRSISTHHTSQKHLSSGIHFQGEGATAPHIQHISEDILCTPLSSRDRSRRVLQ